ncbi:MAG: energy transducer TonB [Bdellovibrionales bacterium]|nr:energy transducer TonB [Bdellovibrionales bacterium]
MKIKIYLQKNKLVKMGACVSLALLTTLVLFYFMSVLISDTPDLKKKTDMAGLIEFIRVKPRSFLDEKIRKLPEKKPKQMKPPKMKMLSAALPKPEKINPQMNMPDIKSVLRSGGPAVGGFGGANLGSEVTPLVRIEPQYPRKAAMQGIEGWVRLQFDITPTGMVSGVQVLAAKPSNIFDRAAIKALRKWKYRPKVENGKPVEQKGLKVQLDFKLE